MDASIAHLRIAGLRNGHIAVGFSALVGEDGKILNKENIPEPLSSAREYESVLVRYFDTWYGKERSTLWYSVLEKSGSRYKLSENLFNALEGSNLRFPMMPVDALGDDGDFQLSERGMLFLALDPDFEPEEVFTSQLWYCEIWDFTRKPGEIKRVGVGNEGVFTCPVWAGESAVWLVTESIRRPGAFNEIFVARVGAKSCCPVRIVPKTEDGEVWEVNPSSVIWPGDGNALFVVGEEGARMKVWKLDLGELDHQERFEVVPEEISGTMGSVTSIFALNDRGDCKELLVNTTSFVDNGSFYVKNTETAELTTFDLFAHNSIKLGLKRSQVSEITFKGRDDYKVQAWVFKPSDFDEKKTYPLAFRMFISLSPILRNGAKSCSNPRRTNGNMGRCMVYSMESCRLG